MCGDVAVRFGNEADVQTNENDGGASQEFVRMSLFASNFLFSLRKQRRGRGGGGSLGKKKKKALVLLCFLLDSIAE